MCLADGVDITDVRTEGFDFLLLHGGRALYHGGLEYEKDYANYRIPKFYDFKSRDAKERKLYELFCQVNLDIKNMVDEINKFKIK